MSERDIVFVDANTIWHRRIAEALGKLGNTVAFVPRRGLLPKVHSCDDGLRTMMISVVPGWASKTAAIGQRQIAAAVRETARALRTKPAIVLTSPKYRLLARVLKGDFPLVYYCADDYREYEGWGGERMAEAEADIVSRAGLAVFVSEALRARAVADYGVKEAVTRVSPNATEPRFLANGVKHLPGRLAAAARPLIGILGGLSARLDLDLIRSVADLDRVGTLAIVGPVDAVTRKVWADICAHPKVLITGQVPHSEMHLYARAFDAALIPYARMPINYFCSPMRLYDHLASGTRIYATDACDQVNRCGHSSIVVDDPAHLPARIANDLRAGAEMPMAEAKDAGALLWSHRADKLGAAIDAL